MAGSYAVPSQARRTSAKDRAETYWLLVLSSPICVNEGKLDPDLDPQLHDVRSVQLVLQTEMYAKYRSLVGGAVRVQGTLFGAHTGRHHTPVLITAKSIQKKEPQRY
jgi:hypothetical protein